MATASDILKKFNDVKTLPHVAIQLSKLMSDQNSSMSKFEEIIKLDPSLVVRLLRVVNSPYYGLQQRVESISRAVVYIGMDSLRNMVVTEALKDIFKNSPDDQYFSRSRLWLHSAAVSICAQMIAERIFSQKGEDAYLCGILHDIGLIVEDQVVHTEFINAWRTFNPAKTGITEHEMAVIGTSHTALGYLLAKEWRLDEELQEAIKNHHRSMKSTEPASLSGIIQIASYIVCQMKYPELPGLKDELSPDLAMHVRDNIQEYKVLTQDLPGEISNARELYEIEEE